MALKGAAAGLRPAQLPLIAAFSAQTRLLVVAPHPDDETIATGVLIQQVRAAGGEVRVLQITSGDNNPWPQRWIERRLWIGPTDRLRWGRRRNAEMLQALDRLQVSAPAVLTLEWPDLGVTDQLLHSVDSAVAALVQVLNQFGPDLVAIPALDDRHPDHAAAHVLVRLAIGQTRVTAPTLLSYLVHGHASMVDSIEIVGSPAQRHAKLGALSAHHSQMVLSGRRMRRLANRPERYRVVSASESRSGSALPWRPPLAVQPWLRLSVVDASGVRSWRWPDAPLIRDRHRKWRLAADGAGVQLCFARLQLECPTPWIFDHWGWCEL